MVRDTRDRPEQKEISMRSMIRRDVMARLSLASLTLIAGAARAEQPEVLWSRPAHAQSIRALAYAPDGSTIVTASDDHTVKLWNAHDGSPLGTVVTHYEEANCLAFSADGSLLATGGQDRVIHVVRMSDLHELYAVALGGFVESVAFSRDGSTICAGLGYSENDQVQLRATDGELMAIVRHHWGTVWAVAYSGDGSYLATSGADGQVFVYTPPSSPVTQLTEHQNDVVALEFSPDSTLLASAGLFDRRLLLHHLPDGILAHSIDVGTATLHGVSFSPDGQYLAAAGEEWPTRGRIDVYLVATGARVHQYTEGTGLNVGCIAYSPDGMALAFGLQDGTLVVASNPGSVCYANCDASTTQPVLNVQDFTCFLQRYAAGESYANCDNSAQPPTLNVQDFTCFLQRYATGCP
jgi:WD40 repeat protein